MVEISTTTLPLGTKAPHFRLPDPHGKQVSSDDFGGAPALLVAFLCNHCPYVKHVQSSFAALAKEYQKRGVGIVGISSNDVEAFPEDGPEKMAEEIVSAGYTFPYLYDESQEVAKAYRAVCTPGAIPSAPAPPASASFRRARASAVGLRVSSTAEASAR